VIVVEPPPEDLTAYNLKTSKSSMSRDMGAACA
jgi:hypothetical protein